MVNFVFRNKKEQLEIGTIQPCRKTLAIFSYTALNVSRPFVDLLITECSGDFTEKKNYRDAKWELDIELTAEINTLITTITVIGSAATPTACRLAARMFAQGFAIRLVMWTTSSIVSWWSPFIS